MVYLKDGEILYHLHEDPLVQYAPLTYHGITLKGA
jgi:hypothetical protein